MNLKTFCYIVGVIFLSTTAISSVAKAQWQTDVEKAAQIALKDGKDILLLYTGSDWDQTSQKLDREVLSQEGFETEMSGDFVLVKLEFPKTPAPEKIRSTEIQMGRKIRRHLLPDRRVDRRNDEAVCDHGIPRGWTGELSRDAV